jgi:hypothetical protein
MNMKKMNMKRMSRDIGVAVVVFLGAACASQPDVDTVAIGEDVALTRADGGVVEGTITSRDDTSVQVTTGTTTKSIPKDEIVDVRVVDETRPTELPPAATFREYTVPEGTTLSLTLATPISSETSRVEDPVEATLAQAVSVGSTEVLPAGSSVRGVVSAVEGSGKVKGLASITLHFTSVAAGPEHHDIDATYSETAAATKGEDATKIGIGAGAGAAIGGLLGGKSGAATGAAIGGGAGTAAVLATTGKEVERRAGATLTVTLNKSVDVRVPIT